MDKSENRFCVYLHIRPDTGKVFYIGIGSILRPRDRLKRNDHWNCIVAKNNGDFIDEILCVNQSWESVCQIEVVLIKFYGRSDNGTGILCNMTDGGDGSIGRIVSEATKVKMRNRKLSPEHLARFHAGNKGKTVSLETRQKISAGHRGKKLSAAHVLKSSTTLKRRYSDGTLIPWMLGRKMSEETKKKVSASKKGVPLSEKGKFNIWIANIISKGYLIQKICKKTDCAIAEFLTMKDAARSVGSSSTGSICDVISGKNKSAKGFIWRKSYDLTNLDQLIAQL